jgi:hypothetical protein
MAAKHSYFGNVNLLISEIVIIKNWCQKEQSIEPCKILTLGIIHTELINTWLMVWRIYCPN